MGTEGFRELRVWQAARDLEVEVYRISTTGPRSKDFGLRDQVRSAAVSIPSNIAEGDERDTNRDSIRFLYIAKGSLAELRTQLEIAREVGLLPPEEQCSLEQACAEIGRMLGALIKARAEHP